METGAALTVEDMDRVRALVQEFSTGCLVPYMDRILRDLSEQVYVWRLHMCWTANVRGCGVAAAVGTIAYMLTSAPFVCSRPTAFPDEARHGTIILLLQQEVVRGCQCGRAHGEGRHEVDRVHNTRVCGRVSLRS